MIEPLWKLHAARKHRVAARVHVDALASWLLSRRDLGSMRGGVPAAQRRTWQELVWLVRETVSSPWLGAMAIGREDIETSRVSVYLVLRTINEATTLCQRLAISV